MAWVGRGNDRGGVGVGERDGRDWWRVLGTLTPHLTSPLKGGRDELGRGVVGWLVVGGEREQALALFADAACRPQLVADVLREQISRGIEGVRCRQ